MNRHTAIVVAAALAIAATEAGAGPSHAVPANPHAAPGMIYARPVPVEIPGEGERVRIEMTTPGTTRYTQNRNTSYAEHQATLTAEYDAKFRRGYDACRSSGLPQASSKYCANTAHLWW